MSQYAPITLSPYGTVVDVDPFNVGEEWTAAENMRFNDLSAQKIGGDELGINTTIQPYFLQFNGDHLTPRWFYMGDGAIRLTDFSTDTDLDVGNAVSLGTDWSADLFNNIPVMNNTVDAPWVWLGTGDVTSIPAFPANTTCQSIRPYRDFLVALNISVSGINDPNRLIFSDASDAGALPPSWDISDPATLAGDAYLTSTKGEIIDGGQLRDLFVIYKTHATYIMRFIGGASVMKIEKIQTNSGILAKNCVQEFKGIHFVVSDGDVVLFDGQTIKSIADKRVRTEIFGSIDVDNFRSSYVARYDRQDEMWFCYPTTGQMFANRAAIWNWKDDTWTFRDLVNAYHISSGLALQPALTYDQATFTYDSFDAQVSYAPVSDNPTTDTLVAASLVISPEISTDAAFTDASKWTLAGGATVTGGQLILPSSGASSAQVGSQDIMSDSIYSVFIDVEAFTGTGITLLLGDENVGNITATGSYEFITTTVTNTNFTLLAVTSSSATLNAFSLKRILPNLTIIDEGFDFVNTPMSSLLEKRTMDLGSDAIKVVKSISPRITADVGTKIYISVGSQFNPDDDIIYSPEQLYNVGVDRKSDFMVKGRYISVKFRTLDLQTNWRLHSFHIDAAQSGSY